MSTHDSLVFLTVRGTTVAKDLSSACKIHNETAGSPEGIAAARALGDLSHKVYAPVPGLGGKEGELLFFDWWKTAEGLGTFFADPRVHGMASKLFSEREGTVWMPARGAFGFELPAPAHRSERFVGIVRGAVESPDKAIDGFRKMLSDKLSESRKRGQISHQLLVKLAQPGAPSTAEVLGVDLWYDAAGMKEHYAELRGLDKGFTSAPDASVWQAATGGTWSEW